MFSFVFCITLSRFALNLIEVIQNMSAHQYEQPGELPDFLFGTSYNDKAFFVLYKTHIPQWNFSLASQTASERREEERLYNIPWPVA
jgi:hypothetical protein